MTRIQKKFLQLKKRRCKALVIFMTAGDPSLKKNEELIYAFEKEGVDLIELGVPFSDPLADGPVIQSSSLRSLRKKTNLQKILGLVKKVRKQSQIPILLMSYLNPILRYGLARFSRAAKQSGVDGVIVPDLPADEASEILPAMRRQKLDVVCLLAPTSTPERQRLIAHAASGFVYYVSLTGVTGMQKSLPENMQKNIQSMRRFTKLPICVGFGISNPNQAKEVSKTAEGIIIGSAIVKALSEHPAMPADRFATKFVRPFVQAVRKEN